MRYDTFKMCSQNEGPKSRIVLNKQCHLIVLECVAPLHISSTLRPRPTVASTSSQAYGTHNDPSIGWRTIRGSALCIEWYSSYGLTYHPTASDC